jgi:hypothetical protein
MANTGPSGWRQCSGTEAVKARDRTCPLLQATQPSAITNVQVKELWLGHYHYKPFLLNNAPTKEMHAGLKARNPHISQHSQCILLNCNILSVYDDVKPWKKHLTYRMNLLPLFSGNPLTASSN